MVIGYFSLFDFGIGRALTKLVAEKIGADEVDSIPAVVWTALKLMLLLGGIGAAIVALLSPWLAFRVLEMPDSLREEVKNTLFLLAASLPVVIVTTALRGVLEAYQRFDIANRIRIPLGISMFVMPLVVLPVSSSLVVVVAVLVLVRVLSLFAHFAACLRVVPGLRGRSGSSSVLTKRLLGFAGWMSVSNLVSPLMVYMDRFLIGVVVSSAAVAYYTTPYEAVTKLWVVPGALLGVLFPAFATLLATDIERSLVLFRRAVVLVALLLFAPCLVLMVFAPEGLEIWLGRNFAAHSTVVCRWLIAGVFANSLGQVAFAFIQARGRPDLTAKLHLIELPIYLLGLWYVLPRFGIEGVAAVWTLRMLVDAAAMFEVARRLGAGPSLRVSDAVFLVAAIAAFCVAAWPSAPVWRAVSALVMLSVFGVAAWRVLLERTDRRLALSFLRGRVGRQ